MFQFDKISSVTPADGENEAELNFNISSIDTSKFSLGSGGFKWLTL